MRHVFEVVIEDDELTSFYRAQHDLRKMFGDPRIMACFKETHTIKRIES